MRTSFIAEPNGQRRADALTGIVTACLLVAAALAILATPASIVLLTGIRAASGLSAPDALPALAGNEATAFFRERDELEIHVRQSTTLRAFLDRNRLNKPFQRAQIVEQLGNAAPATPIAAGTVFKLRLTPMAADIPGTTSSKAGPR